MRVDVALTCAGRLPQETRSYLAINDPRPSMSSSAQSCQSNARKRPSTSCPMWSQVPCAAIAQRDAVRVGSAHQGLLRILRGVRRVKALSRKHWIDLTGLRRQTAPQVRQARQRRPHVGAGQHREHLAQRGHGRPPKPRRGPATSATSASFGIPE
jgi:hypothetical protein